MKDFVCLVFGLFAFLIFRAAHAAYRSSQSRGQIGDTAAGLTPQLTATLDPEPLSKARDQTHILVDLSLVRFC